MNRKITRMTFDEERALYGLRDAVVDDCTFAGPADGESALKESENVEVRNCRFSLRYPLWHARHFLLADSSLDELTRAPIWYASDGRIDGTEINGVKCLRECRNISLSGVRAVSPEFGWKCAEINMSRCDITSEYFLLECAGGHIDGLKLKGKYSFQYTQGLTVENSDLDTKDAFWHAKNLVIRNCTVKGEYLAWYSDGITFENCRIIGTQPLCYCKNLKLVDCTMEDTDLAFEYSDVEADVRGNIVSVKNPKSGYIKAGSVGEIILRDSVMETNCEIFVGDGENQSAVLK